MASQTEENYLKALYYLTNRKEEVNASELSNLLKVSLPTVNSMVKNLKRQGLVNYEKYKPISLTDSGKKKAALVLRKHRLTEMYLVEKMGIGWEYVHEIAEQMEHIHSNVFFERIDELLDFPKIDPHGSPIPDENGEMIWVNHEKLSDCRAGEIVRLVALAHASNDFLKFLNSRDLNLQTKIEIRSVEPYDNSMIVSYESHPSEMLSLVVSESLLIERLQP